MKTADGSYHQCYSGQAVVDAIAQVIVVAELSDQAADAPAAEARAWSSWMRTSRRSVPSCPRARC